MHNTCMFDFSLMLWLKLLVIDRLHPQSNRFAMGVENKVTGDSEDQQSLPKLLSSAQGLHYLLKIPITRERKLDNYFFQINNNLALYEYCFP